MRVILDGVFNHASRGFWPFHHVLETGRHSPYRDWFYLSRGAPERPPAAGLPGRSLPGSRPAGLRWPHGRPALETLGYKAWWNLPALPKLNVGNPEMREYLLGVAEHWIRFGADGWRLDVAAEIEDLDFWGEFRDRVRAVNPEAYLVAEIWNVAPEWLGPRLFDATMNYPLAFAMLGFAAGEHLDRSVAAGPHRGERRSAARSTAAAFAERVERAARRLPGSSTWRRS